MTMTDEVKKETFAEQLDSAQSGEEFGQVVSSLFSFLEKKMEQNE